MIVFIPSARVTGYSNCPLMTEMVCSRPPLTVRTALVTVLSATVPRMICVAFCVIVPLICEVKVAVAVCCGSVTGGAVVVGDEALVAGGADVVCGGVEVVAGGAVVAGGVVVGGVEDAGGDDVCEP